MAMEIGGPCACLRRLVQLRKQLVQIYGRTFVGLLIVVYCGLKGLAFNIMISSHLPVFQSLGVPGGQYQLAQVVASTPWAAKGWIGVLSDCFPLGRYHKRGYLILSSILGMLGTVGLLFLMSAKGERGWGIAALLFLLTNVQFATFDLLAEGKYSELMRKDGAGSEVLSLVWGCINLGGLVGSFFVFFLIDRWGPRPLLAVCLVPMALSSVLACRGWMPEDPARSRKHLRAKLMSQPRLFTLAFLMALGAISVAASTVVSSRARLAVTITSSVLLIGYSFHALPRTLALSNLYMFLSQAAYLDLNGPLGYYYTARSSCVEDGPHFSYGYYLAVGNFVGAIGGVLGSVLFQGMSTWTFRQAFYLTTLVQTAASVFDIVILKRWNIDMGISDQAVYLFGDAACQQLAQMLMLLPAGLLTSRLCPGGAEATVYAVLAGFSNFGNSVSGVLGALMAEAVGIDSSGAARNREGEEPLLQGSCDFSGLAGAVVVSHMILPLLVLPLTSFMVPDARMDDEDAFSLNSPPPAFHSPAASPLSSPRSPHAWPGQEERAGYAELSDDSEALGAEDITMVMDRKLSGVTQK